MPPVILQRLQLQMFADLDEAFGATETRIEGGVRTFTTLSKKS